MFSLIFPWDISIIFQSSYFSETFKTTASGHLDKNSSKSSQQICSTKYVLLKFQNFAV